MRSKGILVTMIILVALTGCNKQPVTTFIPNATKPIISTSQAGIGISYSNSTKITNSTPTLTNVAHSATNLFSETYSNTEFVENDDPSIIRARQVEVNFEVLGTSPIFAQVLGLNLFEDVFFIALLDRVEQNPSGSFS